jgi:aminoglycoside phosphotransferase
LPPQQAGIIDLNLLTEASEHVGLECFDVSLDLELPPGEEYDRLLAALDALDQTDPAELDDPEDTGEFRR